jgi:endo-1,4-beta-xylanase
MVFFSSLLLSVSAFAAALAHPTELAKRSPGELIERQTITASQTGTSNGFYYSYWSDGGGSGTFTLGSAGQYTSKCLSKSW